MERWLRALANSSLAQSLLQLSGLCQMGGVGERRAPLPPRPPSHGPSHNRGKNLLIDSRGPQMLLWAAWCVTISVVWFSLLPFSHHVHGEHWPRNYTPTSGRKMNSPQDCMSGSVRFKSDYTLLATPRQPPASEAECSNPGETRVPSHT